MRVTATHNTQVPISNKQRLRSTPRLSHFSSTLHTPIRVHFTSNPLANQESQYHNLGNTASLKHNLRKFRYVRRCRPLGSCSSGCGSRYLRVHALCTPLAFSARHLQAYIIPSLQGFLLCGAEHQSLSACLSLLQTLIVGLHNSINRCSNFPSTRSVGLHVANVAFAVVDVWWWLCNLGMPIRGGRPVAIFANNDRENNKRFGHEQF